MTTQQNQIVFIDSAVADAATLLAGLPPGLEVVMLQPGSEGLSQMAAALAGRTGIEAIHLLTHGSAGSLNLGSTALTSANLDSYNAQWATVRSALTRDADFLIYGCDVAAGDTGAAFISQLASLTGADVAASTVIYGVKTVANVVDAVTPDIINKKKD